MLPVPWHWKRPPQSPVWQLPTPAELNEQPVRPQIRPPQPSGTVKLTLCPGASFHPVTGIGCWALGFVAAQIVSVQSLTMVIRCEPEETAGVVAGAGEAVGVVGVEVVDDVVLVGVGVGEGLVLVRVAPTVIVASGLEAGVRSLVVLDVDTAVEPSAVLWAANGPAVVSQSAADTAATTAITEARAARGTLRARGALRLLRSMLPGPSPSRAACGVRSPLETLATVPGLRKIAASAVGFSVILVACSPSPVQTRDSVSGG